MHVGVEYLGFEHDGRRGQGIVGAASDGQPEYPALVGGVDRTFDERRPVQEGGRRRRAEVYVRVAVTVPDCLFKALQFLAQAFRGSQIVPHHLAGNNIVVDIIMVTFIGFCVRVFGQVWSDLEVLPKKGQKLSQAVNCQGSRSNIFELR